MSPLPLELPEPDDRQLAKSPLTLVVAQVRHERLLDAASPTTALSIRGALGKDAGAPTEHRQQVVTLMAGPGVGNAETIEGPTGWQFQSPDSTTTTVVQQEFFSVETNAYATWAAFRSRLEALARGVGSNLSPQVEQRVGLRYIDLINHPNVAVASDWVGLINSELLGAVGSGLLSKSVWASQQVLEIEGPGGIRANLRHGSQSTPAGRPAYLLDLDCYLQEGRGFDVQTVLEAFDELHDLALRLFQTCLTSKLLEELQSQ